LRLARERVAGLTPVQERRLLDAFHDPLPRVALGAELSRQRLATSAIDVSDGLGVDAARLARASRVRLVLEKSQLPASEALRCFASRAGLDPLELMLSGGDDYELLFTVPAAEQGRLAERAPDFGVLVTRIGRVEEGSGAVLSDGGAERDIAGLGHDHLEAAR
jgi:thiamine-monophosphate kinase